MADLPRVGEKTAKCALLTPPTGVDQLSWRREGRGALTSFGSIRIVIFYFFWLCATQLSGWGLPK